MYAAFRNIRRSVPTSKSLDQHVFVYVMFTTVLPSDATRHAGDKCLTVRQRYKQTDGRTNYRASRGYNLAL